MSRRDKQRALFDGFRTTFKGGRVLMSPSFHALPPERRGQILSDITRYQAFDKHGYHDAGLLIYQDCGAVRFNLQERKQFGVVLTVVLAEDGLE